MSDTVSSGAAPSPSSEDRSLAFVAYALLFVSPFVAGLTALVAVVIAYVRRSMCDPVTASHYNFQIRIFWIGIVLAVVSMLFLFTGLGVVLNDVFQSATNDGKGWDAWQVAAVDETDFVFHPIVFAFFAGWLVVWAIAGLWAIVASIFGMARLSGDAPVGRLKA